MLYKALFTIDPSLVHRGPARSTVNAFTDQNMTNMRALQEKRQLYLQDTRAFLARLRNMAEPTFDFAFAFKKTRDTLGRNNGMSARSPASSEFGAHDVARNSLWQYSPLMLFAKEVDYTTWQDIVAVYQAKARSVYQNEVRDNIMQWKKATKKPTGDEQEALFTTQEKENEGLTGTARKLTVKRSQTLAKNFRTGSIDKRFGLDKSQGSKDYLFESFAGVLEETVPLIFTEQNFIIDFFHATSLDSVDFVDLVTSAKPSQRRGTNVLARKAFEPDRTMARKVFEIVESIFITWPNEMQNLADWATQQDPL